MKAVRIAISILVCPERCRALPRPMRRSLSKQLKALYGSWEGKASNGEPVAGVLSRDRRTGPR